MKYKVLAVIGLLLISTQSIAGPSINNVQSCQALLDFIETKLATAPEAYPISDVELIKKGIGNYNGYLQREIVTPGLVEFNGGDQAKAQAMQEQVNAYKATLVSSLQNRYKEPGLFTDHAFAVNDCVKKATPSGQVLEDLKTALTTIVKLSKIEK